MGQKKGINIQVEEDLDALFKEFNLHCKARNLSEATLEFYQFCWQPFKQFLEQEGLNLSDVNRMVMNAYIVHLYRYTFAFICIKYITRFEKEY